MLKNYKNDVKSGAVTNILSRMMYVADWTNYSTCQRAQALSSWRKKELVDHVVVVVICCRNWNKIKKEWRVRNTYIDLKTYAKGSQN